MRGACCETCNEMKLSMDISGIYLQAASLTTVGKRACIWSQDVLIAFKEVYNHSFYHLIITQNIPSLFCY